MKKLLFVLSLAMISLLSAQTEKGNFLVETSVLANNLTPNTGFGYSSVENGVRVFNVGFNGGYFIKDNLAVKAGIGYGESTFNNRSFSTHSFRAGLEYNVFSFIPFEVSYVKGMTRNTLYENPEYLTTQFGVNIFLNENVALKPLVRYDTSLTKDYENVVSLGFALGYYF